MLAVIDLDLVSVQMIASLCGNFKHVALSPSSFFHWSNRRGKIKEPTPVFSEKWCGLPCTYHFNPEKVKALTPGGLGEGGGGGYCHIWAI